LLTLADDPRTASLHAAYERLASAVAGAPLDSTSPIRTIAMKTLNDLREQIAHDPTFIDHLIQRLGPAIKR
jgi:hypothetical protein